MLDSGCLLFDGAMGTYLAELTGRGSGRCELMNLTSPNTVHSVHRAYVEAGAGALRTNTFGANTALLGRPFEDVAAVLAAGWRIANDAARGAARVFADIGPLPDANDSTEELQRIADAFLALGATRFLFETFGSQEAVLAAARHIREALPSATVVAQFAAGPDGFTRRGVHVREIRRAMEEEPAVDAWGLNCLSGPQHLIDTFSLLGPPGKPLTAMPNAGYPSLEGNRTVYANHPDYFAGKLAELRNMGIRILGGCCGTTPSHIARAAAALQERDAFPSSEAPARRARQPRATGSRLKSRLQSGRKAIAAEVDPPKSPGADALLAGARRLIRAGADALTAADNPLARVRADSSMTAAYLARRGGCEALPHIACRDRNLNAIQSLLLGLHIEGIRAVLAVTGDPVAAEDRGEVKAVFNADAAVLAAYIKSLNAGPFSHDPFFIGGALNVNAPNFDAELRRAERKMKHGVEFFLTQPVFSEGSAQAVRRARSELGAAVLAGLMPLAGYRNAQFLRSEVPGMDIPEEVAERFRGLEKAAGEELGVRIALETAERLLPWADGFHIVTPLERYRTTERLIEALRREIDDTDR